MAKKKTTGEDAADAFLRSKGVNPADFLDVEGLDKLTKEQIAEIAKKATQGDPAARAIADKLVTQNRLMETATPTGRVFEVPSESKMEALAGSMKPLESKPVTAGEQAEAQLALERNIAKKKAAQPAPEPIEKVARPEQAAQKQKLVQAAKEEKARQASAEAAAELEKPAPAAKIEGGELRQTGSEADRLAALKKRNFKAEWGKLPEPAKRKILVDDFGERALQLNKATQQKLGEMAVARQAFKQSALTAIPDMDDAANSVFQLANRIENSTDLKGIENSASITHQRLLTGQSGKIRGNLLTFRKPRAGEVGSAKIGETEVARPKPESGVEERSPGFDKAKVAEVPADAKNAKGKLSVDDVGVPAATPEAPAAAAAAAEVAAEATAAAAAAAPAAAAKPGRVEMTEAEKKSWGDAVRADKTKYGTSSRKATEAQKAARNELAAKIVAGRRGGAAAATAAATAPVAPPTTTAPTVPAVSGGAPAAPAAATAAPAAAAATSKLPNPYGKGPWKPNPARNVDALKKRAAQMGIGKGLGAKASGVMRFLGPLAAIYGAYEVANMLKQGTIDESDERRLKAMQALGMVSGGMGADLESKAQVAQMQRMVDMAAIQRQKTRDEMQNRYVSDQALNSLLAGHQASLAALAQPSRPSIAEMMARM